MAMIRKPTSDGFETMAAQAVPDQSERYGASTTQLLEESQDRFTIVIGIGLKPEIATYLMPVAAR